jgi:uncharacterized protein YbaP (TraB family)
MQYVRTAAATLVVIATLAMPVGVAARDQHLLWAVKGRHNTVYLLGSVHVLRPGDAALPPEAEHAFDDAERLVMEIDVDDPAASPLAVAGDLQRIALLPPGQTLHSVLGSDYASINEQARRAGVDLEPLDGFAPWFVALTLLEIELAKRGYSPEFGIEQTLAARAIEEDKPIEGLETPAQQLEMLASMPMPMQGHFLAMTLQDSSELDRELDELMRAWKTGDTAALARLLADEHEAFPDLYRRLTVDRNRVWVDELARLLDSRDDYLVVVGALHLVGPDSVVELLRRRGYTVTRE